jgi:hypothetical protein
MFPMSISMMAQYVLFTSIVMGGADVYVLRPPVCPAGGAVTLAHGELDACAADVGAPAWVATLPGVVLDAPFDVVLLPLSLPFPHATAPASATASNTPPINLIVPS